MHYLYRHAQPMSVMAGWAGSDPAGSEGHQRHGSSGGPTGSASARPSGGRLALLGCFTPLRQSPGGEVSAMGSSEAAEKLSLEEDPRTSTEGGFHRAGT